MLPRIQVAYDTARASAASRGLESHPPHNQVEDRLETRQLALQSGECQCPSKLGLAHKNLPLHETPAVVGAITHDESFALLSAADRRRSGGLDLGLRDKQPDQVQLSVNIVVKTPAGAESLLAHHRLARENTLPHATDPEPFHDFPTFGHPAERPVSDSEVRRRQPNRR